MDASLAKGGLDISRGECLYICRCDNTEKILFGDSRASVPQQFVALLAKKKLENCKYYNIETLVNMGAMCWVTDYDNLMEACKQKEGDGVM